jgi:hypothetical protein
MTALLLPVILSSKRGALTTDDVEKLRQLGQAAGLYEQYTGEHPMSTLDLVESNLVPVELCSSRNDSRPRGIANEMVSAMTNNGRYLRGFVPRQPSYKSTFLGPTEHGFDRKFFFDRLAQGEGGGWLVDYSTSTPNQWPYPMEWSGKYRRLLMDGAVVVRTIHDVDCGGSPCRSAIMQFLDKDAQYTGAR